MKRQSPPIVSGVSRCSVAVLVVVLAAAAVIRPTDGFQSLPRPTSLARLKQQQQQQQHWQHSSLTPRYLFGRDNNNEEKRDESERTASEEGNKEGGVLPFFSRLMRKEEKAAGTENPVVTTVADEETPTPTPLQTTAVMEKPAPKPSKLEDLSPMEQAKALRAQAEKARLEAERMDAQLTLEKISRLERELAHAKKTSLTNNLTAKVEVENLMRDLEVLQAKMRGETVQPKPVATTKISASSSSAKSTSSATAKTPKEESTPKGDYFSRLPDFKEPLDENVYQGVLDEVTNSPDFMKKAMAAQVGVEYDDLETLNVTEVALRLDKMSRFDFSFGGFQRPSFTKEQIDEMEEELARSNSWANGMAVDPRLKELSAGNKTEWALLALEYQYFMQKYAVGEEELAGFVQEDEFFDELISQFNISAVDGTIDQFYPKCTRKEGMEPTEAQVKQLMTEVLPKAKFTTTAKPEKVAGGFVVRGNSRYDNGDELIEAIDKHLAKTSLSDKMTVLYTRDFTVFVEDGLDDGIPDLATLDPILYVVGPDIVREPRRVWLSLTSGLGLATCWYLSLYPFLLNPGIASRVDEELALVDAGMTPDLSWLTDLSVPLFVTFVGIQIAHEIGHRLAAAAYGIKPTFPTFVPSIITGVTTTVTTFKEPPKNLQAMFDFSVAGPLVGMVASIAAIVVGAQLSMTSDLSMLPNMPLEILRQSSLGGGILDAIMGNGVLSVPDGALGTRAVATMTIPLHPVAVAGFIGLIVNALNVLPIGTTDGGRMAQNLFGRGAKLLVGNIFLLATLVIGIGGSDLFLFYFAFCIAFQTGNEIPARNEVDDVDISRIFIAIASYLLAALALIPLQ
uniref:Peptidase M50 domain-containing protein n=1 Tax=Amphora coffeiformis TaxID=265554 RepID=A0A7S3P6Y7_9STRA